MTETNTVTDYGWSTAHPTGSASYITPHVLSILARIGATRVLDIGAGNGALCAAMADQGIHTVGMEYDKNGVAVARKEYPSIKFYNYGVQDEPSALLEQESEFDAVVSTEVIEHLYSPHLLPQYAQRVLRSGGYLVITTPYHGYLKNLALALFDKWYGHLTALWHGGHIKFWSRNTLSSLLEQHGFQVESFSGVGRVPYLWKSMVLVARKQ